ncbi:hypothetical protein V6N12_066718 [Hibiscus sabdariffa]|uniref:Tropinone reductase-like 3 n=1 Tax=Hibiscus sabdariffa TaxID=183260 RepID=A0ABR2BDH4_9ROSI
MIEITNPKLWNLGEIESKVSARRFEGKVAIVTASTQGIGFAIAECLALEGASVVISSRKQENVDEAVEKLKAKGIQALGVVCHVSNAQQRKNLINRTVEQYGKLDVFVSNAAVNPFKIPLLQTEESVLDKPWETNVKSSVLLLQDAAPYLQKGSLVLFISSLAGFQPLPTMAVYGVTKTALLGLTKALAAEMAPNVRVNCVAPSFMPTRPVLLHTLGTVDEIAAAAAAAFLASDDASYITGETLIIAGGTSSRL